MSDSLLDILTFPQILVKRDWESESPTNRKTISKKTPIVYYKICLLNLLSNFNKLIFKFYKK